MKRIMTGLMVFVIAMTLGVGIGFAGNGKGNGGGKGGGTQDRKRDGSCTSYTIDGNSHNPMTLAKQQSRDRKRTVPATAKTGPTGFIVRPHTHSGRP